jgi:L-fuconolactonase
MRIDSHHHFWNYSTDEYSWINDQMSVLRRDFGPTDLQAVMTDAKIDRVISVQARQTLEETTWLLELAKKHPFVAGVVGWVPLASDRLGAVLDSLSGERKLKAVRHVVHDEPDDRFILGDAFNRGIAQLKPYDLVYDILIYARHLPASIEFVDKHPGQRFVLDHIAKPTIHHDLFDAEWARNIRELGRRQNVACKFSGVATEVHDPEWSVDTVRPYWDVALEAFGPNRLMFGSDWPVCLLKTGYRRWVSAVEELARTLSAGEQELFWSESAVKAYSLDP